MPDEQDDQQQITAQTADGVTHSFPAGTDPAVMDKAIKQYMADQSNTVSIGGSPVNLKTGEGGMDAAMKQAAPGKKPLTGPGANIQLPVGEVDEDEPVAVDSGFGPPITETPRQAGRSAKAIGATMGSLMVPMALPELAGIGGIAARGLASAAGAGAGTMAGSGMAGENPISDPNLKEAGLNAALYGGGDMLSEGIGAGLSKIAKSTPFKGIINRSIGATPAEARFADPAQAILDTTTSPRTASRAAAVSGRIKSLAPELNTSLATSTVPLKVPELVDKPIDEGIQKILDSKMLPNEKQGAIDDLNQLRSTLKNTHKLGGDGKLVATTIPDEIAPYDANRMKQQVGEQISSWAKKEIKPSDLVEKTYRGVYHNLEQAVSGAVPGTSDINSNLSNALAAKRALKGLGEREAVGRGEMAGFATVPRLEAIAGKIAPAGLSALGKASLFPKIAPSIAALRRNQ